MSALLEQEELVSIERAIPMRRAWAMPSANTFSIAPIRALVRGYLGKSKVSVDPFARNKRWATFTNDLNPDTAATSHLEAREFLNALAGMGVVADLGLFDPPYNVSQAKEVYQSIGIATMPAAIASSWKAERDLLSALIVPNGIVISCNWNSNGMGIGRGFAIEQILIVAHGREHNDTIVTVERKVESAQSEMFAGLRT